MAFRSLSRLSSALSAKASTLRSYSLNQSRDFVANALDSLASQAHVPRADNQNALRFGSVVLLCLAWHIKQLLLGVNKLVC